MEAAWTRPGRRSEDKSENILSLLRGFTVSAPDPLGYLDIHQSGELYGFVRFYGFIGGKYGW